MERETETNTDEISEMEATQIHQLITTGITGINARII